MGSEETVKINVNWEAASQGVSEEEVLDTELTREQWDALGEDGQEALGQQMLADWRDNLVQSGWSVVED